MFSRLDLRKFEFGSFRTGVFGPKSVFFIIQIFGFNCIGYFYMSSKISDTKDIENINGTMDKGRHIQEGGQKTQQMATENQNKSMNRTSRKNAKSVSNESDETNKGWECNLCNVNFMKKTKYWNAHTVHNTSAHNALICQQNYMTS